MSYYLGYAKYKNQRKHEIGENIFYVVEYPFENRRNMLGGEGIRTLIDSLTT